MTQDTTFLLRILLLNYLNFFIECYAALNLTMFNCSKRPHYWIKLIFFALIAIPFYFLPDLNVGIFNLDYLIILTYCFVAALFLYKESILKNLLYIVSSFAIQHIAWNIMMAIFSVLPSDTQLYQLILIYLGSYFVVYGIVAYLFLYLFKKAMNVNTYWPVAITSIFLILLTYFLSAYLSDIKAYTIATRIYDILACLFALVVHFGLNIYTDHNNKKRELEKENLVLERNLTLKSKEQSITKETMEVLDQNVHEIRRELNKLLTLNEPNQKLDIIDQVSNTLNIYDKYVKTGNETLDLILIEHSLIAEKNHIVFSYLINPLSLSFMSKDDILSLFGNMLDNAIEGSLNEDKNNRLIRLNINEKGNFIYIHLENFCTKEIKFSSSGLPITSKSNKENHGFGTKIISKIVKKYNGNAVFKHTNNIFAINVVLPKQDNISAN